MNKLSTLLFCASLASCSPVPASDLTITSDSLPDLQKMQMDMILHGYHEDDSDYAQILINLPKDYKPSQSSPACIAVDEEMQLRPKFSDIKLAYKAKIPNGIKPESIIGASPLGMYMDERHGWTGFKIYFQADNNAVCSFGYIDLSLSGGNIVLNKDDQNFSVNHKPGFKLTTGSKKSGFVYSVNWYDKEHVHMLDCATLKFDKHGLKRTEAIAYRMEGVNIQKSV